MWGLLRLLETYLCPQELKKKERLHAGFCGSILSTSPLLLPTLPSFFSKHQTHSPKAVPNWRYLTEANRTDSSPLVVVISWPH